MNTSYVSLDPQELNFKTSLDELQRSRQSRKRAWENLQEIRWLLKDVTGIERHALVAVPRETRERTRGTGALKS